MSEGRLNEEVDAFVRKVSAQMSGCSLPSDEVPEFLRLGEPDSSGWCRWQIQPLKSAPWLDSLEAAIGTRLPPAM